MDFTAAGSSDLVVLTCEIERTSANVTTDIAFIVGLQMLNRSESLWNEIPVVDDIALQIVSRKTDRSILGATGGLSNRNPILPDISPPRRI